MRCTFKNYCQFCKKHFRVIFIEDGIMPDQIFRDRVGDQGIAKAKMCHIRKCYEKQTSKKINF